LPANYVVKTVNEEVLQPRLHDGGNRSKLASNDAIASNPGSVSSKCGNDYCPDRE